MTRTAKLFYEFGPFRLDAAERLLWRDGEAVPLTPKVFDTLLVLVENSGRILSKEDVMRRVWADAAVEEASLTKNISTLRKALGQKPEVAEYIETIPWRGYRFVAEVREVSEESATLIVEERTRSRLTIERELEMPAPMVPAQTPAESFRADRSLTTAKWRVSPRVLALCLLLLFAIAVGLWWVKGRAPSAPAVKTLAVLPFKSLSPDTRDEYLGLGMADTLIIRLSNIKQLAVRPTSAVRKYSGDEQDPLLAGREQQVDAVLDGNFQKAEGRIRVTARLIKVDDGLSLWAGSFDEKDSDLFRLQDAIVERLAGALTLKLTGEEQQRLTKRYTENTESYLLYLKGRYHLERRTIADVEKSIDYFQQALAIDPQYALAYAGLAEAYPSLSVLGAMPAPTVMPQAKAAVAQALRLDDQLAEAYSTRGLIKTIYDWDFAGAEQDHQQALKLNSNSALAHRLYGHLLRTTGRFDEALTEFNRALTLEPLSLVANRDLGVNLYCQRQPDRAIEQFQKTIELDAGFATVYGFLERAYEAKGLNDQAVAADLKTFSLREDTTAVGVLKAAYQGSGWMGYWRKRLELVKAQAKPDSYVEPYQVALIYTRLGEKERAFEWLEKAYQERGFWLNFVKIEPLLDPLRTDARFADLLRRIGL
jgi:DNA-binding winged helix-turn-helix (wHTH) protein/TolB-like protein/Tfp pilus assembly protein PilF